MRAFKALVVIVGVIILFGALGAFMNATFDFRTQRLTETFNTTTGVGSTNVSIQLAKSLMDNSLSNFAVSSNQTVDAPAGASYNATSRVVVVNGLADNSTHSLSATYRTGGLTEYTGAENGIKYTPAILISMLVAISILAVIMIFTRG